MPINNKRAWYWGGFIIIVIIYSLYNLYLVDVNYYKFHTPKSKAHQ